MSGHVRCYALDLPNRRDRGVEGREGRGGGEVRERWRRGRGRLAGREGKMKRKKEKGKGRSKEERKSVY